MGTNTREKINDAIKFQQGGQLAEAEVLYSEILAEEPNNASVLNLLGLLKIQSNMFEQAVELIKKAVELNPCDYFCESLGRAYFESGDYENAVISYNKSLEFSPDNFDAWFNLGLAYKSRTKYDEAIEAYNCALKIKPNNPDVFFNLANIYEYKNDTETSLEYYKKAYEYNVNDSGIHYFMGVAHLKLKHWKEGWEHYEGRPSRECGILTQALQYKEQMTKPLWQGEPIRDKTLFIYYESGLGDSLMYARYFPMIRKMCAKVLFKPQVCFIDFFKENNYGMEIIETMTMPEDVVFDTHIPLMSIPYVLQLNSEEQIPLPEGFLRANPIKVQKYKEKYFNHDKFKIGIKWQGNPAYALDRIIPLSAFYKIFNLPGTQFYSVQKGSGEEELETLPNGFELVDLGSTFDDFSDTAAAIENMDLVICNDTSVAHLAAGMGKPCWILLPFVQNWRWHNDLTYSPWYKSVKLFKQVEPGNWDEVFERVYVELKKDLFERQNWQVE